MSSEDVAKLFLHAVESYGDNRIARATEAVDAILRVVDAKIESSREPPGGFLKALLEERAAHDKTKTLWRDAEARHGAELKAHAATKERLASAQKALQAALPKDFPAWLSDIYGHFAKYPEGGR